MEFSCLLLFLAIVSPIFCRPFDFGFGSSSYPTYFFGGNIQSTPRPVPETYRPATLAPVTTTRPNTSTIITVTFSTSRPTTAASNNIIASTKTSNTVSNTVRQTEDILVGLPTYLEGQAQTVVDTVQDGVHNVAAKMNKQVNVALSNANKEVNSFLNAADAGTSRLATELREQTGLLKTELATVEQQASQKLKHTVEKMQSQASELWNTTAVDVSKGYAATDNFFTSTWASCRNWWNELEEEVKDFCHFVIKVVEIVIGLILLFIALWAFQKIKRAYSFVKRHTTKPEDIPMTHMEN